VALKNHSTLREEAIVGELLTAEQFDIIVTPQANDLNSIIQLVFKDNLGVNQQKALKFHGLYKLSQL